MPVGVSAYVPLATKTLTATATSVTFSSISQAYRDLVLVAEGSAVSGSVAVLITLNNDNSSGAYANFEMSGNGSTRASTGGYSYFYAYSALSTPLMPATDKWLGTFNLIDYSATNKHKKIFTRSNVASVGVNAMASLYKSLTAVTSIKLAPNGTSFTVGSTFTLYGIQS